MSHARCITPITLLALFALPFTTIAFERVTPPDSSLTNWQWPFVLNWTPESGLEGETVYYIFHLETSYFEAAVSPRDAVVTDTFMNVQIDIPVLSLDDIYEFRWRVWASDGQDTVEALNGEGFFQLVIPENADETHLVPTSVDLFAYPNPFNPATSLSFSLDKPRRVVVALYDVHGRHVSSLADEVMTAGSHIMQVDGSALPSGVYFASLQAGTDSKLVKLILLK